MKKVMFLMILFFIFFTNSTTSKCFFSYPIDIDKDKTYDLNYDSLYLSVLEEIKNHEGYRDTFYYCAGGHKTIGYGHVITKNDSDLQIPISKKQAEKLLRKDFDKCIEMVKQLSNLSKNKLLAMAHFSYCLGIGNLLKSGMLKKDKIDNEIIKWCKIRKPDSTYIISNYLLKIRKYELNLYNLQ